MSKRKKIKFRKIKFNKQSKKILFLIAVLTFVIAMLLSYIFEVLMKDVPLVVAFCLLICIILIGIFFDGLGNAVVSATETPFHAMASKKVKGAKESIRIIRNAPMVANLFNDVIGDICGIISGSAVAAIVLSVERSFGMPSIMFPIALSGFVAALTVGGKAIGKSFSIERSHYIVYYLGLIVYYIKKRGNQ
ncbi:MAG: hypothetical protein AB9856_19080 [Cellulosilyticaceae bacterium]